MSRHVDELFEALQKTCAEQFCFVPERILDNIQYMGPLSGGRHRFRDSMSHAEIHLTLNPVYATLFERPGQTELDWPEELRESYRKTDDQFEVEYVARQAKLQYAIKSPIWATHGAGIRSTFAALPDCGSVNLDAYAGTYDLVVKLLKDADPEFAEFAERMGANDAEELSFYLLDTYKLEIEAEVWEVVKLHPNIQQIGDAIERVMRGDYSADKEARRLAQEVVETLPAHLKVLGVEIHVMGSVMRNRSSVVTDPAPEGSSPTP